MTTATEDLMSDLGDTNLSDHYQAPEREHGPPPPKGLDSTYDESPLVVGHDGDDAGPRTKIKFRIDGNGDPERTLNALAPGDMMSSGHGFLNRAAAGRKTEWRTTCEVCNGPLPPQATEDSWVCERGYLPGTEDWDTCNCNWCLIRGQWLRGEYRPRGGRPPQRCGTAECKKIAARIRKQKSRGTYVAPTPAPKPERPR